MYVYYGGAYLPIEGKDDEDDTRDDTFLTSAYNEENGKFISGGKFLYCSVGYGEDALLHCYICDSRNEMIGGEFFSASSLLSVDDVLYFGTEGGHLCCFNTDKRDENGNIDRNYYTFNGRRYSSGFSTKSDNCDIPSLTKSTIKHSLCMHLKSFGSGRVKALVRTDQDDWKSIANAQNGVFSFDDIEFDSFTFNTSSRVTLIIPEKEKRWAEKQYHIYSDEYKRPFGIFDISYRFKVAGRIKNK